MGDRGRDNFKRVLTRSLVLLMKNTGNIHELLVRLVQKEVISPGDMERVNAKSSKSEMMTTLAFLFERKPESAWHKFVEALNESRNEHVVEDIHRITREVEAESRGGATTRTEAPHSGHTAPADPPAAATAPAHTSAAGPGQAGGMRVVTSTKPDGTQAFAFEMVTAPAAHAPPVRALPAPRTKTQQEQDEEDAQEVEDLVNLILYIRDQIRKRVHFNIDEEYTATRFKDGDGGGSDGDGSEWNNVKPDKRGGFLRSPGIQHFRTNSAIWLSAIGFYGPALIASSSYTVEVNLYRDTDGLYPEESKIGTTRLVVQAYRGQIFYIPFKAPVGIEPNVWYKLVFTISGMDRIRVASQFAKLASSIAPCGQLGDVRFKWTTYCWNSSKQLPVLKFFKGKDYLLTYLFPTSNKNLTTFTYQEELRRWQEANEDLVGVRGVPPAAQPPQLALPAPEPLLAITDGKSG